ncbi:hypothetical protein FRC12_003949 [Ceratobasidium sp. 428]|nr:hypothetical protein FRC12_003949 [Ceratobasidium sp. 428]
MYLLVKQEPTDLVNMPLVVKREDEVVPDHFQPSKPVSGLFDEQRRILVKQLEVESVSSTTSRASSEEDNLSGLGQQFYAGLDVLRSVAVSCGANFEQGAGAERLNLYQAKDIYEKLALVESLAGQLCRMLTSHFPLLAISDDLPSPSCGPSSTPPLESQQIEADTSTTEQANATTTPVGPDTALTSMVDIGQSFDSSQTFDPSQTTDSTQTTDSIQTTNFDMPFEPREPAPFATYPSYDEPGERGYTTPPLPNQSLYSSINSSSAFGAGNVSELDTATYSDTTRFVGSPLNSAGASLPSNVPFASSLDTHVNTPTSNTNMPFDLDDWLDTSACLPDDHSPSISLDNSLNSFSTSGDIAPRSTGAAPIPPVALTLPTSFAPPTAPALSATPAPPPVSDMILDRDPAPRRPCSKCGKTFRRPYLLRDHMRTHSGEGNVYRCTFESCGKRFGSQSNLTRHFKTHNKPPSSTPLRDATPGSHPMQDNTTPRRSQRLQNTVPNPMGQWGYRILEPQTPTSVRAQEVLA